MIKDNKTGFMVYDFMIDRLCLNGVPLMVFALIYSFSMSSSNCHGSIEYMARRVGASCSAVKRALNLLLSRELIIKRSDKSLRTKIYLPNLPKLIGKDPQLSQIDPPGTDMVTESNLAFRGFNFGYNNKEIIKTTTSTTTITRESEDPMFLSFGDEEMVWLTMDQHIDLKNRLGDDTLNYYIARLEGTLIKKPGTYLKNHYKTILKWAREDAELEK